MSEPLVTLTGVGRRFGGREAVCDVSLSLEPGRILGLLGPSGSGKSTLLRLIAGLNPLDTGRITIDGTVVATPGTAIPPDHRRVGMVFQDFALFPHLTVLRNVAFGVRGTSAHRRDVAMAWLDRVRMTDFAGAHPHTLSGGEQQRVALARALAPDPRLVLLDEPFSSLDTHLREAVRDDLAVILRETATTAIMVTHDAHEAMRLVDDLAVLDHGRLLQQGSPREVHDRPRSATAARLLGPVNLWMSRAAGGRVDTPFGCVPTTEPDGPVLLGLRPGRLRRGTGSGLAGAVRRSAFAGDHWIVEVETALGPMRLRATDEIASGEAVTLDANADAVIVMAE